ncbi:hypothetical protein A4L_08 [Anabaena phage A-4L]|uniref:Uncharacterized protein n=1 Tax=Anabaena phage A-4L TaxID=1357732 RepID=A0A059PY87_9CAUD|nr:hypothetical protein A4L_08 [Anabaena phage A-4L]AGR48535.1 hypothetical protein A4L_08 [Anabaena phage A-4L]
MNNDYIQMLTEQRNRLSEYAKLLASESDALKKQVELQNQVIESLRRESSTVRACMPDMVRYAPSSGLMLVREDGRNVVYTRTAIEDEFVRSYLDYKRASRYK